MPGIDLPGLRLHYRWDGIPDEGPILVLSHSLGASLSLWGAQVEDLGKRFRILRYDHRGHGRSSTPTGEWCLDDFGEDLLALLDGLGIEEPVHFCGLSLGGMVGLWLGQQAPDRLDRLVVANTSAYTEDPTLLRGRIEEIERTGLASIGEGVLDRWFTETFRASHPELEQAFRKQLLATPAKSYMATSRAICDLDLRAGLNGISLPTLVITGQQDSATPPAWGEAIAASIPEAALLELPAAHLSNIEAATAFNEAVGRFLLPR